MPHPRVKRMRERLGELLELALNAPDQGEAERILTMYERGEINRQEAIQRLRRLATARKSHS